MNVNYYFCMYKSYFFVVVVAALLPRMHIINILPASAYKHTEAAFFFGCFFYFLLFLLLFHTRILCVDLVFNFVSFDCSIRGRPQIEKKKNSTKRNSIGTRWRLSCYGRKLRQLHSYFCVCVIVAHRVQRARGRSTRFLTVSIERHAINTTLHNKLRSSKGSRTKIEMWQSIPVELAWHESLDSMYKYNVSIFSVPRYLIHHKIWCNQITHFYQAIRCIISLCFFFSSFYSFLACHRRVAHQKWPIHAERTYLQSASWKWSQITRNEAKWAQPTHEANFMMITSCFYWPNQWLMITRSVESSSKSLSSTGLRACEPFVIAIRLPSSPPYIPPLDQLK